LKVIFSEQLQLKQVTAGQDKKAVNGKVKRSVVLKPRYDIDSMLPVQFLGLIIRAAGNSFYHLFTF